MLQLEENKQETTPHLVAAQHALDQIAQRSPEILAAGQVVLVNEEHVLLEARVQMRLQTELPDDGVVVAVNVSVDTIHALEDLAHQGRERLGEGDA